MSDSKNEPNQQVEPNEGDEEIDEAAIFIVNLAVELGNNQPQGAED